MHLKRGCVNIFSVLEVTHLSSLLGNVCILVWAPMCSCVSPSRCRHQYRAGFPLSKPDRKIISHWEKKTKKHFYNSNWNLHHEFLPQAVWWYPPGLWCCSTGASQRQRTTCPTPAVCLLSLFCPPLSFSSHSQAAAESRLRSEKAQTTIIISNLPVIYFFITV